MRRFSIVGVAIALCVLGWSGSASGQKGPAPRGELRVVDHSPLNWVTITLNVFEHFLYNPIMLYAVNRAVAFEPYATTVLFFKGTLVAPQHWSVRKAAVGR